MVNSQDWGTPEQILRNRKILRQFDDSIVDHETLSVLYNTVLDELIYPDGTKIILVIGPTGVGKTTLMKRVEKFINNFAQHDPDFHAGRIAVRNIHLDIIAGKPFDWQKYYRDALLAFDEPLIDYKINYQSNHIHTDANGRIKIKHTARGRDLHDAWIKTCYHRKPYAVQHDEAQAFARVSRSGSILSNMNTLKTIVDKGRVIFVLYGTYEMHHLIDLNAQTNRRSVIFEFPRYLGTESEHKQEYVNILDAFQDILESLGIDAPLVDNYEFYFAKSLGCVGMLDDWLKRTLKRHLRIGGSFHEIAKQTAMSDVRLNEQLTNVKEGERIIRGSEIPNILEQFFQKKAEEDRTTEPHTEKKRAKPGEQLPRRYPVGR